MLTLRTNRYSTCTLHTLYGLISETKQDTQGETASCSIYISYLCETLLQGSENVLTPILQERHSDLALC